MSIVYNEGQEQTFSSKSKKEGMIVNGKGVV